MAIDWLELGKYGAPAILTFMVEEWRIARERKRQAKEKKEEADDSRKSAIRSAAQPTISILSELITNHTLTLRSKSNNYSFLVTESIGLRKEVETLATYLSDFRAQQLRGMIDEYCTFEDYHDNLALALERAKRIQHFLTQEIYE